MSGSRVLASIDRPFQVNCVANVAWLLAWHYDFLNLSLLIMLVLLGTLLIIYRSLLAELQGATVVRHFTLHLPFSLYTGWITLATIANLSAVQTGNGWDDVGLTAVSWTLLKIAIVGVIGATAVLRFGDAVFVLVVAWGAYGISAMQFDTPAVYGAATSLALLSLLLAASEGVSRLVAQRRN